MGRKTRHAKVSGTRVSGSGGPAMLRAMIQTFLDKRRAYARVLVQVGAALRAGDKLLVSASLEAADLVRDIAAEAYRLGALDVRVDWHDGELERLRFAGGTREAALFVPPWAAEQAEHLIADGYTRIGLRGDDPALLAGLDSGLIAERTRTQALLMQNVSAAISGHKVVWTLGAAATPAWARNVYPDLPEAAAVERLWDDIFTVSRIHEPDPVVAWRAHTARLERLTTYLTEQQFAAVHFQNAEGTDLTVGLAEGHRWDGGAVQDAQGRESVPNLPTDEVFTAPHRERVSGVAVASKPLAVRGEVVRGIRMTSRMERL